MPVPFDVQQIRSQFPALSRNVNGEPAVFFDGPGGSQVPQRVADAVIQYLTATNANHGGPFATSRESDQIVDAAHRTLADFLGTSDPDCIAFGANMTSITFALSRALARNWSPGDEILVTQLDHDANVTPWMLAARAAGTEVRQIAIHPDDCTLDIEDFELKLTGRTKLVAVGYASNATGGINPIREIVERAHAAGALIFVDAVHYAPHGSIDVERLECDFLACSPYKFFGPHIGVLYGKRNLLESLQADQLRPVPDTLPDKWMTGTQNHEGIAGAAEAVEYLADLGRRISGESGESGESMERRTALAAAYSAIANYERQLVHRLLSGLSSLPGVRVFGITDLGRLDERLPTVSFTHTRHTPIEIAEHLGRRGIFVWPGNHYALPFTQAMQLEPAGTLRIGPLHYNTPAEIDRLISALGDFL